MHVRTSGGEEKEIDGKVYDCQIKDLKGRVYHFKAYRLDKVTVDLGDVPSKNIFF